MMRLALPTGDLRGATASLLDRAGCGIGDYAAGSRLLRFEMFTGQGIARVFREKDIPVQVALGNYDLGICSLASVEELAQRFPRHDVVRVRGLGFGGRSLWLATADGLAEPSVRIVSEYPHIAEAIARRARLPRYRVFGVAGAAEAYPPEDADLALVAVRDPEELQAHGLQPVACVLDDEAWLIANRRSLASRDLAPLLASLIGVSANSTSPALHLPSSIPLGVRPPAPPRRAVRIALADGHNQKPTIAALRAAGVRVPAYEEGATVRRPEIGCEGVSVKVIRPQDMTQQVALGQFDLAITGRDLLFEHLLQFPSSPVEDVADLQRSRYGLAIIVKDVPAASTTEAVRWWRDGSPDRPIRIASEFPNIADHFARERHFGRYSVIPISGASEGFVPDDAEILIEGIDTGSSVRANNLTVLERFFESTIRVIANRRRPQGALGNVFEGMVASLRDGAREAAVAATEG